MSLSSLVLLLILKKTSLLLSVTLMLRCSTAPPGTGASGCGGVPFSGLSAIAFTSALDEGVNGVVGAARVLR